MDAFWLSHHPSSEWSRTLRIGGVRVCARCLGTYPVLFAALVLQVSLRAPPERAGEWRVGVGLLLPALSDWCVGRLAPASGSNAWRLVTGALLGLGLGRALYLHVAVRPFPAVLLWQLGLSLAVAGPVWLYSVSRRKDLSPPPDVGG
jgi:uncharacterized membrane protein